MNERIQEIAEQATDVIEIVNPDTGITHTREFFDKEKFAELIVRECVIRAEREWIRNGSDTEHNKAITGVIKSIKEHFGVEE
jgi:hypothetical protein